MKTSTEAGTVRPLTDTDYTEFFDAPRRQRVLRDFRKLFGGKIRLTADLVDGIRFKFTSKDGSVTAERPVLGILDSYTEVVVDVNKSQQPEATAAVLREYTNQTWRRGPKK